MANRYTNIKTEKTAKGVSYYTNAVYPEIPLSQEDYYVVTTAGDRYDTLASHFYGDDKLWWIIASANNYEQSGLVITPGVQIRIPASKTTAIQLYNQVNTTR
jgi:histidyl-tRNA synthetase